METLLKQALAISSGTLATLTGHRDYETLDRIQQEFVLYAAQLDQTLTWQQAWAQFSN